MKLLLPPRRPQKRPLPLHHCAALGCQELTDPGEIMCRHHWNMVSLPTIAVLVAPRNSAQRSFAEIQAVQEVAVLEGRNPAFSAHSLAVPTPDPKDIRS